ncbi:MAG: hypothetical protein HYV07_25010 [Deltaproteobacteria bacterium]|nr:hypothetical protein [Deltaproteobacteria bacterium]
MGRPATRGPRAPAPPIFAALILVLGPGLGRTAQAAVPERLTVASALDGRVTGGPNAALPPLEAMEKAQSATSSVSVALLRARLEVADRETDEAKKEAASLAIVEDGLKLLSRSSKVELESFESLANALDRIPRTAAGSLFFTTLAYGLTIPSMALFSQMGAAKTFLRALERTAELEGTFFHGAPHRALSLYLSEAPGFMGGDSDRALAEAKRAAEIAPFFAENLLILAEVTSRVLGDDGPEYERALARCAALPDQFAPGSQFEHRAARDEARSRLKALKLEKAP